MDQRLHQTAIEQNAIIEVIARETELSCARDFAGWATCFVQDHRTTEIYYTSHRGVVVNKGWDRVAEAMASAMAASPDPHASPEEREDFTFTLSGNLAFVTYRSRVFGEAQDRYLQPDHEQFRVLEKHDGDWRILTLGFFMVRNPNLSQPLVQVDQNCRVVWASENSLQALAAFEGLEIRKGYLQTSDPAAQAGLARIVRRAHAKRDAFFEYCAENQPQTMRYPCLLGTSETGGTMHCTIFMESGAVNVVFGDQAPVAKRVETAREIFGLSDNQARVVLGIAKGDGLPTIARSLGISVNTARTHLTRVYEKTGISNQPSLVRLVLSVGQ